VTGSAGSGPYNAGTSTPSRDTAGRLWAEDGSLPLTPGSVVDYGYVKRAVLDAAGAFDLQLVEFDRWNSSRGLARPNGSWTGTAARS
jgi:hypothetical protein